MDCYYDEIDMIAEVLQGRKLYTLMGSIAAAAFGYWPFLCGVAGGRCSRRSTLWVRQGC